MTVKPLGNGKYEGLAADTKPTAANTAVAATFYETDTSRLYQNTGSAWIPTIPQGGYSQIVFKRGSTYYAADNSGKILNSSTTNPGAVIQTCLDLAGKTYISAGDYMMGASFAGVNVGLDGTHLELDAGCTLIVPIGYNGYVIRVRRAISTGPNLHHATVSGGKLYEDTGVDGSHLWTGILMQGGPLTNQGVGFSTVRDIFVEYAATALNIDCTLGWVNGCTFQNITASGCNIGFDFNQPDPFLEAKNAIARDTFISCIVQDYNSTPTAYGFKNVRWKDHTFLDCKAWDLDNTTITQRSMTIHRDAKNMRIIGGIITQDPYFVDNSKSTIIVGDEWSSPRYAGLTLANNVFGFIGRKTGLYDGLVGAVSTNANGLMNGVLQLYSGSGTPTAAATYGDTTPGCLFPTTSTINSGTGLRSIANTTFRGWNPIYRIMFKLTQTADTRPYFGWCSGAIDLAGDDPLNALSGVILTLRQADTNFQIGLNDGSGATTFVDTGIAKNTTVNIFDLVADDAVTNKWKYALYPQSTLRSITAPMADYTDITSANIPAQTTALKPYFQMTTAAGAIKTMTIHEVFIET